MSSCCCCLLLTLTLTLISIACAAPSLLEGVSENELWPSSAYGSPNDRVSEILQGLEVVSSTDRTWKLHMSNSLSAFLSTYHGFMEFFLLKRKEEQNERSSRLLCRSVPRRYLHDNKNLQKDLSNLSLSQLSSSSMLRRIVVDGNTGMSVSSWSSSIPRRYLLDHHHQQQQQQHAEISKNVQNLPSEWRALSYFIPSEEHRGLSGFLPGLSSLTLHEQQEQSEWHGLSSSIIHSPPTPREQEEQSEWHGFSSSKWHGLSSSLIHAPQDEPSEFHVLSSSSSSSIPHGRHLRDTYLKPGVARTSKQKTIFICIILTAIFAVFSCILMLMFFCGVLKMKLPWHSPRGLLSRPLNPPRLPIKFRRELSRVFDPSLSSISLRDLMSATNNFSYDRVIGDGGFGMVYSAELVDGRRVAVKKLAMEGIQGKREFEAEMETLGKLKHPNLVELLAYCKVGEERVLVYDFVENGSLDVWLHERECGPKTLDWAKRLKIAQGAARGLSFLHHECDPHIIHRDIKSSNILLTKDFEAQIADFGLARLLSPLVSHVSTDAAGTIGYIAPEYALTNCATRKVDIYSFGMVMLELASGKRPNLLMPDKDFRTMAKWSCHMLEQGKHMDILDPVLLKWRCPPPHDQVLAYLLIACDCVSDPPGARPSMTEVYERLSSIGKINSNLHVS